MGITRVTTWIIGLLTRDLASRLIVGITRLRSLPDPRGRLCSGQHFLALVGVEGLGTFLPRMEKSNGEHNGQ